MSEEVKKVSLYKNIIGDTKATIDAIQRFIAKNSPKKNQSSEVEQPALSIKKILESISDEEINEEIQKIIDKL